MHNVTGVIIHEFINMCQETNVFLFKSSINSWDVWINAWTCSFCDHSVYSNDKDQDEMF